MALGKPIVDFSLEIILIPENLLQLILARPHHSQRIHNVFIEFMPNKELEITLNLPPL